MEDFEMKNTKIFCKIILFCILTANLIVFKLSAGEKPSVFVSILPQVEFAQKICGDKIDVQVMVRPGQSPHSYAPTPKQMAGLARSTAFFAIGVPFEKALLKKIRNVNLIDCCKGIQYRSMKSNLIELDDHNEGHHHEGHNHDREHEEHHDEHEEEHNGHDHDHDHDHDHGHGDGMDPHVWLSPVNAKIIVRNMCEAFKKIDAENAGFFEANSIKYIKEIDNLHNSLSKTLAPFKGQYFFVFHPAFGYFADCYHLKQVAVEVEGKAPRGRELAEFISKIKKYKTKVIFVQPQFSINSAKAIASATGGAVVPLNPLAKNYIENLQTISTKVSRALKN
jgi:zinc transport system substrate-binding protein